jgi:pyruvate/2-oxoglutarate dehydrogenase complex dihydrolipoamide acyltransferase (E2) component
VQCIDEISPVIDNLRLLIVGRDANRKVAKADRSFAFVMILGMTRNSGHRTIDGIAATQFMAALCDLVEIAC